LTTEIAFVMIGLEELLRRHPFMKGLREDIVTLIARSAKNIVVPEDDYVFREGARADNIYLIRSGVVALEMFVPGRGAFTFLTVGRGEILGADWLISPYRWSFDARAAKLTNMIEIDATRLRDKCEFDQSVGYEMMKRFIPPLFRRMKMIALAELANTS